MIRHSAFAAPGRFWRGNLHSHSTLSDGALPPAEVCRRYQAEGYDFLALTDHFVGLYNYPVADTVPFRSPGFTTLLGAELHSGAMVNGDLWHVLAVGLPPGFAPSNSPDFHARPDQETAAELAARAAAAGAFVAVAHPHWSGLTVDEAAAVTAAHAVEIYNHNCEVDSARGHGALFADLMLTAGRRPGLIATDDAHFHVADAFGGWVMVKAPENTPEALLPALKRGDYYASQGPQIHDFTVGDGVVHVECSAAVRIFALGQGVSANGSHGTSMTRAEVRLRWRGQSPWLRVVVVDAAGRMAWTNPVWLD